MNVIYYADPTEVDQGAAGTRTIAGLKTAIGSSKEATIVLTHTSSGNTTTYTLSTSLTLTSNIHLKIDRGAVLSIATGKTLTVNGSFDAGSYQIFSCIGTGKVQFSGHNRGPIKVEWFGAKGDSGVTDNSVPFQKAIDSTPADGGVVEIGNGTFSFNTLVSGTILTPKTGVTIRGQVKGTILTVPDSFGDWDFFRSNSPINNLAFEDFVYDGNGENNLAVASELHNLFFLQYGDGLRINNITFQNISGQRCASIGTAGASSGYKNVKITNNTFHNVADAVTGNIGVTDHSSIWSNADNQIITGNTFINDTQSTITTAIEVHGKNIYTNNLIHNYNIGVISAAIYDDTSEVEHNNNMTSVQSGYRFYCLNSKDFDVKISGGSIEQSTEIYPIIDLDYFTSTARRVVIDGVSLRNSITTPTGNSAFGIAIGRINTLIINNVDMENLACRGISVGENIGLAGSSLRLHINNIKMVNCGRTTAASSYAEGIAIYSTEDIVILDIAHATFINTTGSTPMLKGISGNVDVAKGQLHGLSFYGITTEIDYPNLVAAAKDGFYATAPIVQPVLATGAGKTVDNVITVLQALGLVKQH